MTQSDPMLGMLAWLCSEPIEAEVSRQLGRKKGTFWQPKRISLWLPSSATGYTDGNHLMVSKIRQGGHILFFVTERKRREAALIQVVQEAFVQDISTRKSANKKSIAS